MNRKEKIIEILKSNIHLSFIEDELTGSDHPAMTHKYHSELTGFEQSADAIMAIPLEMPSDVDIEDMADKKHPCYNDHVDSNAIDCNIGFIEGAKWAINEILKRNGKGNYL